MVSAPADDAVSAAGFEPEPSGDSQSLSTPTATGVELHAGDKLNGYELQKKLGEGGMGTVHLARQMSLERDVAVKVLSPQLSASPALVGRFMREAYAAGQLVHHNVVQIHDFGKQELSKPGGGGLVHYFSMEFVDGGSLLERVKRGGRLKPSEAVGHVLQAARGLAFAHEHGLIHRDIKPDNLMLNRQGLIKVADLGLVKQILPGLPGDEPAGEQTTAVPGLPKQRGRMSQSAAAQITQVNSFMGTPAYMPPEQADDAKNADARADIYSLGCTLYYLLVGKPPFSGNTLQETLDGHRRKPLKFPADSFEEGSDIDEPLRKIVEKMCAKRPMDRHASMDSVVFDLQRYLRSEPSPDGASILEAGVKEQQTLGWCASQFATSKWARAQKLVFLGFAAAVFVMMAIVGAIVPDPVVGFGLVGGVLGFAVLTVVITALSVAKERRDALWDAVREWTFYSRPVDWMVVAMAAGAFGLVLLNLGWLYWWLGGALGAWAASRIYLATVEKNVRADRQSMVSRAELVLRDLRSRGMDEVDIRKQVVESAGLNWEPFYESMFGHEAKLEARRIFGRDGRGQPKPRPNAWRDWAIDWFQRQTERRRLRREKSLLQELHAAALESDGITREVAMKQASAVASRDLSRAVALRDEVRRQLQLELLSAGREDEEPNGELDEFDEPGSGDGRDGTKLKRKEIKYTDDDFERIRESYFKRRYGTPADMIFGQPMRGVLGLVLMVCFALWFNVNQEAILSSANQAMVEKVALDDGKPSLSDDAEPVEGIVRPTMIEDYSDQSFPVRFTGNLGGWPVGLTGLMLMVGAAFHGRSMAIANLVIAGVCLIAPAMWDAALPEQASFAWLPLVVVFGAWFVATMLLREDTE